uniref:RAD3-like helicase DEAD domain-containing protein n=1 Tax=Parascaris equorum TaxID=6256 RepID=A0A914R4L7_PAREQ
MGRDLLVLSIICAQLFFIVLSHRGQELEVQFGKGKDLVGKNWHTDKTPKMIEGTFEFEKHTILASREHSCINLAARNSGDVNGKCKELISAAGVGCLYKNSMRGKYEKSGPVRKLVSENLERSSDVWDIEDLVSALKTSSPTLYPMIRDNSDVTLKNAVVILDEAHNVEDVCREAVSFSFTEREIVGARADLCKK